MTKTNMTAPKPIGTLKAIDQRIEAFVGLRRACLKKGSADGIAQAGEYMKMINELLDERLAISPAPVERIAA